MIVMYIKCIFSLIQLKLLQAIHLFIIIEVVKERFVELSFYVCNRMGIKTVTVRTRNLSRQL